MGGRDTGFLDRGSVTKLFEMMSFCLIFGAAGAAFNAQSFYIGGFGTKFDHEEAENLQFWSEPGQLQTQLSGNPVDVDLIDDGMMDDDGNRSHQFGCIRCLGRRSSA